MPAVASRTKAVTSAGVRREGVIISPAPSRASDAQRRAEPRERRRRIAVLAVRAAEQHGHARG